jgi:hypothetical protein
MGLSLVSKVAPISIRGLMMGGWFVATAIGNKLTQIGIYWDIWLQSQFFLVLALMALFMAVVLAVLLKPLKKAMSLPALFTPTKMSGTHRYGPRSEQSHHDACQCGAEHRIARTEGTAIAWLDSRLRTSLYFADTR